MKYIITRECKECDRCGLLLEIGEDFNVNSDGGIIDDDGTLLFDIESHCGKLLGEIKQ